MKPSHHKLGIIVGSNSEKKAGLIHPVVWEKEGLSSLIKNDKKASFEAIDQARKIATKLNLKLETAFVVRIATDNFNVSRAIVCLVVESLDVLGKKVTLFPRFTFPLESEPSCLFKINEHILPLLRGRGMSSD